MKRLLILSLLLWAGLAHAQGSFVQGKGSGEVNSASVALAFTSNNTAGNTIVVLWRDLNSGGPTANAACSDSRGNTYYMQPWGYQQINYSGFKQQWYVCYAPNISAGANTVTASSTGSSVKEFYIGEYSGLDTTKPLDVFVASANTTGGSILMAANVQRAGMLVSAAFSRGGSANAPSAQTGQGWSSSRYTRNGSDGGMAVWDQSASGAGTVSNNAVSSGGTPGQFNGIIVVFRTSQPSVGFVQGSLGMVSSSTTVTATLPFSLVSINLLVASATSRAGATPTFSGCSATWRTILTTNPGVNADMTLAYAMNVSSGSCTVTATFGSSQESNLIVNEYKGANTAYALEIYSTGGRSGSPISATTTTIGSSDIVVSVVNDQNHTNDSFTPSSGYGARQTTSNAFSSSAWFDQVGAAGTFTDSVAVSPGSSNLVQAIIAFRSVLPTVGPLQFNNNTCTSATSCTVAFPLNNTAGNMNIVVVEGDNFSDSTVVTLTDTVGNTYARAPIHRDSGGLSPIEYVYYAQNTGSGANTASVTQGGSATTLRLLCMEATGLAAVDALAGSSMDAPTNVSSGYVISPGTSFMFSFSMMFAGSGSVASPGAGFISYPGTSDGKLLPYIEIGSAATYINTPTLASSPQFDIGLVVFTTTQNTQPRVTQGFTGNADAGNNSVTLTNVNGDTLLVFTTQDSGTPSISDSKGNVYTSVPTSDSTCGVFYTTNIPAGSNTVSMSTSLITYYAVAVIEVAGVNAFDASATQSGTGTTVNTPTLTTAHASELVVSSACTGAGGNSVQSATLSSPWSGRAIVGQHIGGEMVTDRFASTAGTYSNSFTFGSSLTVSTVIFGLYNAGGTTAQPAISIITDNIERMVNSLSLVNVGAGQ